MRKKSSQLFTYVFLTILSVVMIYPLIWLIGASFKSNAEIFSSIWFVPKKIDFTVYKNAWENSGTYNMGHYFLNTFIIVIPKVIFTVISSTIVAYGFAKYDFPLKKFFFALMIAALFLPQTATILPSYVMWEKVGLTDTYAPLILPSLFASDSILVYMLIQFFKDIPQETDDAASIDGCGALKKLFLIYIPCVKPAVISTAVFTFLWTMNDFINPLVYISSVKKYPIILAIRMSIDSTGQGYDQNKIIAVSVISLIPSIAVFAAAQKKFVNGIATGGIVG